MTYEELVYCLKRTHFFKWGFDIIKSAKFPEQGVIFNDSIHIYFLFNDVQEVVDMDFYVTLGFGDGYVFSVSKEGTIINL